MPGIFSSKHEYDSIPATLKKLCPEISLHLPGKNLWRVTSESKFTINSRYVIDMPLIADQGGSIALLLIPAIIRCRGINIFQFGRNKLYDRKRASCFK